MRAVEREVAARAPRGAQVNVAVRADDERRAALEHRELPRDERHALERRVLERARVALVQAFGRDVVVPSQLGERPRRRELPGLKLEAGQRLRLVVQVGLINREGLAVEEVRERLVRRDHVGEAARREPKAPVELVVDFSLHAEAKAHAQALSRGERVAERRRIVARSERVLLAVERLVAEAKVSAERERAELLCDRLARLLRLLLDARHARFKLRVLLRAARGL